VAEKGSALWVLVWNYGSGLPDFFLVQLTKPGKIYQMVTKYVYKMAIKYAKWPKNIPSGHKIYQHFPFQGSPKYTQIWIFGMKRWHLATLLRISRC
jgi:hypothetical protein